MRACVRVLAMLFPIDSYDLSSAKELGYTLPVKITLECMTIVPNSRVNICCLQFQFFDVGFCWMELATAFGIVLPTTLQQTTKWTSSELIQPADSWLKTCPMHSFTKAGMWAT